MSASSEKILELRQLLADRFGKVQFQPPDSYLTGLPALDEIGIPRGTLTEIVSHPAAGPGGGLLLYALLHAGLKERTRVMLIDGKDSFQPGGLPQGDLDRLLWTRCPNARQAIKAADLAVRDGNLPLVALLLTLNPESELRPIPAGTWHRLQMVAEKSSVTLLVFTPQAQVGCAALRISVGGTFPLGRLHCCREELISSLRLEVKRQRNRPERRAPDEALCRAACA